MTALSDRLGALREPEFRKLFLGQAISVVGVMFAVVALPFAVLSLGGTATDIGIVAAANLVPLSILLVVGGVWADRLPRQKVMLVTDFVRAAAQMVAAALLVAGVCEIWHLVLLQVMMGAAEAFFLPAYTGLVPQTVSAARLQQANALRGLTQSLAITMGSVLAGLFVSAVGPGWAIGIDALTYVVSAWYLWRLHPRTAVAADDVDVPQGFFADLAAGWREFVGHTWLWVMVAGLAIFFLAIQGPIEVLGPVVSQEAYDGARTWGFCSAAVGLGQIAGGLLSLRWRPRRPLLVVAAGMSLVAVPVAMLAVRAPDWMLLLSLVVIGVEWGLYEVFWVTCMQSAVPPDMISRVSSYDVLGSLAFFPAGVALAGPLADAFGISNVLWVSAAVAVGVSVFQLSWKDVRAPHAMGGGPAGTGDGAEAGIGNGAV
jgi:MFS family permease